MTERAPKPDIPSGPIDEALKYADTIHKKDQDCSVTRMGLYKVVGANDQLTGEALSFKVFSFPKFELPVGTDEKQPPNATHKIVTVDQTNPREPEVGMQLNDDGTVEMIDEVDAYAAYRALRDVFPDDEEEGLDGEIRYKESEEHKEAREVLEGVVELIEEATGWSNLSDRQVVRRLRQLRKHYGEIWPNSVEVPQESAGNMPPTEATQSVFRNLAESLAIHGAEKRSYWEDETYEYSLYTETRMDSKPIFIQFIRTEITQLPSGVGIRDSETWEFHTDRSKIPHEHYKQQFAHLGTAEDPTMTLEDRMALKNAMNGEARENLKRQRRDGLTMATDDDIRKGLDIMKAQADL